MPAAVIYLPPSSVAYDAALEGLTAVNRAIMLEGGVPPLYSCGARYQREGQELWRHCGLVCSEGKGDCEDLSSYRAAELQVSGEDPGAWVHTYVSGPGRLHAIVCRGDGSIEDPSLVLGMQPQHPGVRIIDDPLAGVDEITCHRDVSGAFAVRMPLRPAPGVHKAMMVRPPRAAPAFRRGVRVSGDDIAGFWGSALRVSKAILSTPEARALLPAPAQIALARSSAIASAAKRVAQAAQGPRRPPPAPPPAREPPIVPDEYIPPPPPDEEPPPDDPSMMEAP